MNLLKAAGVVLLVHAPGIFLMSAIHRTWGICAILLVIAGIVYAMLNDVIAGIVYEPAQKRADFPAKTAADEPTAAPESDHRLDRIRR